MTMISFIGFPSLVRTLPKGEGASVLKPSLTVGLLPRSLPRAVLYRLPPFLSPQDLLVRFLHNLGDAVGLAHRAAGRLVLIVELSSVHLALILLKLIF